MDPTQPPNHSPEPQTSATAVLLNRARGGDVVAREELFERIVPILRRWAHRRLPFHARDLNETSDLVQITLLRALNRIGEFEARGEGAFLGYLRRILLNVVREEIRRSARRGPHESLEETLASPYASLAEQVIGNEQMERYQRALETMSDEQQQAVLLRLEFGYTYQQIAEAIGKPSPDAARMTVVRAINELAQLIDADHVRRPTAR
jgi:RNA polymerase sigma-70 factor (ECF subfamily)